MVPAGTQVLIAHASTREILFTGTANGTRYYILPYRHVRETLPALQHRYFADQNPLQTDVYQRFTQVEKDAIRDGKIVKGMSKEAVLMDYGYPPSHRTVSLELNAWTYWIDSRSFEVDFVNDRVSEIKGQVPGQPGP
jgi:hypothetical protein